MNILDENVPEHQVDALRRRRLRLRQIGRDVGRAGMQDEDILPLLHRLRRSTFFTRDADFYDRRLCHAAYALVYFAVTDEEFARFVRLFLRHPAWRTQAQRQGRVIRVGHAAIRYWRVNADVEAAVAWTSSIGSMAQADQ